MQRPPSADGFHVHLQLREGEPLVRAGRVDPCALVIFGATGDLAERKLFPALFELFRAGSLPDRFAVVAFARSLTDPEAFLAEVREGLDEHARTQPVDEGKWQAFRARITCVAGAYDDPAAYERLRAALAEADARHGTEGNRLHYFATPASTFPGLVDMLGRSGLLPRVRGAGARPWARLVVEKPFGRDLASARALNAQLGALVDESQVFRIDHYLGKETVQNLLVFRFANAIFEPLWNRQHVDHVEITAAESIGVEGRGGFYDETGVVRDMVQNHLLQVLALVAMEPPVSLAAEDIRDEKNKVFRALRPLTGKDVARAVVRGQYEGYRQEPGVSPTSQAPTFVGLRVDIDTWRWQGVPFYVRAGKRLAERVTEVAVHFRSVPISMFGAEGACQRLQPNVLTFRIQPDEGVALSVETKVPGEDVSIAGVTMDFFYKEAFHRALPEAYERLLLDAMRGNATLFARGDSVEEAWRFITPVLQALDAGEGGPLHPYAPGGQGPDAAAALLRRDGRYWRRIG